MFGSSKTKAWKKLESIYNQFKSVHMRDLFANDIHRAEK